MEVVAAVVGAGHTADDRYPPVIEQSADDARLDVHDVANETDVHFFAVDDGGSPLRSEQPCVLAGDADRERSVLVEQSDDVALHLTDKNHPYDVHRLRCRDAQTAGEDLVHAQPVEMGVDLGAAAMDDDHANAGVAKEDHVLGERPAQRLVAHRMAAVLDHDSAAVETLEPRQGLDQNTCLCECVLGSRHVSCSACLMWSRPSSRARMRRSGRSCARSRCARRR